MASPGRPTAATNAGCTAVERDTAERELVHVGDTPSSASEGGTTCKKKQGHAKPVATHELHEFWTGMSPTLGCVVRRRGREGGLGGGDTDPSGRSSDEGHHATRNQEQRAGDLHQ